MTETRTFRPRRVQPSRVRLGAGGYSGRFEVYLDGQSIGWVIRQGSYQENAGTWTAFTKPTEWSSSYTGRKVDEGASRLGAVMSVVWHAYSTHDRITKAEYEAMNDETWFMPEGA